MGGGHGCRKLQWGGGGAAVDREEVNDGESKRGTETDCMGRGYLGQGHRPSSGLIHALHQGIPPPPCISYANVHNYYGPYAYCSLEKGVSCAQHIQLPTHTCAGHVC